MINGFLISLFIVFPPIKCLGINECPKPSVITKCNEDETLWVKAALSYGCIPLFRENEILVFDCDIKEYEV